MSTDGDHGNFFSQSIKNDSDSNPHLHGHHHEDVKNNKNRNSNNTKSCKVMSNPLLLEDLRFHILTFVPLNCLLNSARYVCKYWAATIGNSYFAKVCEHSKLGIYVVNRLIQDNSYFLEFKDDVDGEFERIDLGTPQRMGRVIDTCDGMLLLWNYYSGETFFVNPILKSWIRLPHFPITQQRIAFYCTIARVPRTTNFKLFLVVSLEVSGVFWYVLYMLRIGGIDNSWKEIGRKEAPLQRCQTLYNGDNDLFWITKEIVMIIDVGKEIIARECPLPNSLNHRRCLLLENCLSFIATNDSFKTIQIYILDFDSGKLSLRYEITPFDFVATCGYEVYVSSVLFCFWINDHIIFLRVPIHQYKTGMPPRLAKVHFGYNVKTKQLTKIGGIEDEGVFELYLHINTLISLPNSTMV